MCRLFSKSGSLNLLEPSGYVQTCNGIALPFYDNMQEYGAQFYDNMQEYGAQFYDNMQEYGAQFYDKMQEYGAQFYVPGCIV
jgi:hypothetical protein